MDKLLGLASDFGIEELVSQCEKLQKKSDSDVGQGSKSKGGAIEDNLTIRFAEKLETTGAFLSQLPIDRQKLIDLYKNGTYSDVELSVDGIDELIRAHRLILSAWSHPFAKVGLLT